VIYLHFWPISHILYHIKMFRKQYEIKVKCTLY